LLNSKKKVGSWELRAERKKMPKPLRQERKQRKKPTQLLVVLREFVVEAMDVSWTSTVKRFKNLCQQDRNALKYQGSWCKVEGIV